MEIFVVDALENKFIVKFINIIVAIIYLYIIYINRVRDFVLKVYIF